MVCQQDIYFASIFRKFNRKIPFTLRGVLSRKRWKGKDLASNFWRKIRRRFITCRLRTLPFWISGWQVWHVTFLLSFHSFFFVFFFSLACLINVKNVTNVSHQKCPTEEAETRKSENSETYWRFRKRITRFYNSGRSLPGLHRYWGHWQRVKDRENWNLKCYVTLCEKKK